MDQNNRSYFYELHLKTAYDLLVEEAPVVQGAKNTNGLERSEVAKPYKATNSSANTKQVRQTNIKHTTQGPQ